MTANRAIRASDHDRESVVEILGTQYTAGRLTLAEFDERMAAAYDGKTWGDLLDLTRDLPADVRFGTDLAARPPAGRPAAGRPAAGRFRPPPRRFVQLAPLLIAGAVLVSLPWGGLGYPGHHHHYLRIVAIWPLLVVVLLILRCGTRRGGPFR